MKAKANYHGLMYGIFNYAVEQGFLAINPCARTAPKRRSRRYLGLDVLARCRVTIVSTDPEIGAADLPALTA